MHSAQQILFDDANFLVDIDTAAKTLLSIGNTIHHAQVQVVQVVHGAWWIAPYLIFPIFITWKQIWQHNVWRVDSNLLPRIEKSERCCKTLCWVVHICIAA